MDELSGDKFYRSEVSIDFQSMRGPLTAVSENTNSNYRWRKAGKNGFGSGYFAPRCLCSVSLPGEFSLGRAARKRCC